MEIHASTQYTYKTYRRFYFFTRYGKYYKLLQTINRIIALVYIVFNLYIFITNKPVSRHMIFNSLIWICIILMNEFITPKIWYKRGDNLFKCPIEFTFYEDEISLINNDPNHIGTSTIKYNQLYKAYETGKSFYLYLDKKTVYPVEKDGISPEAITQLRDRFQSNLGRKRYIRCI